MYLTMILSNLLSNVENLPKIGPPEVVGPYTGGWLTGPRRGCGRRGEEGRVGLAPVWGAR